MGVEENMKKLILVYNPVSGDALFKYKLDELIEKFSVNDCIIIPYRTLPNNEVVFAKFVRSLSVDGVIIAGGDGTIHDIINLMITENIDLPIGLIPSGTSNDFASFLGINKNLDRYIKTIAKGSTMPVTRLRRLAGVRNPTARTSPDSPVSASCTSGSAPSSMVAMRKMAADVNVVRTG